MSHFLVIVVGDNVDYQLEPYDENLLEPDENGKYNEYDQFNAKWDYWGIGGRWDGFFLTKDGKRVNEVKKKDLDFKKMQEEYVETRLKEYDKVVDAIEEWIDYTKTSNTAKMTPISWSKYLELHDRYDVPIDVLREFYNASEGWIDYLRDKHDIWLWVDDCPVKDYYDVDRDEFIAYAKRTYLLPIAFVKDGEWVSYTEMGWFGISEDYRNKEDFVKEFWKMIDSLDDEEMLTVVDCHI